MGKYIDFSEMSYGDRIPDYTQETIENYLVKGLSPGGFVESMLSGDLWRAAIIGDFANGPQMQDIAKWIQYEAPDGSWGSYDQVKAWLDDTDGRRSKYVEKLDKAKMWRILKT